MGLELLESHARVCVQMVMHQMHQNLDLDSVSPVCGLQLAHDQMKLVRMAQHQCSETGGESRVLMVLVALAQLLGLAQQLHPNAARKAHDLKHGGSPAALDRSCDEEMNHTIANDYVDLRDQ